MTRGCNLLFATAMLAVLCVSGLEPASAQRAVQEDDYRKQAEPLPQVQRAKASKPGKTTKSTAASVANVVSDGVIKTGSKISGGWREYAADLSWRRVVFTLDGRVATVVFSDGKPGSLLPAVTHFARSGPGPKGSPATYNEVRTFAGATPGILDKAKQSSSIPSDIATRIRDIGGDIKLMQQLADIKRISELGTALDAARVAADGGFFPDRPGGSPGKANWSAPWRGVGRGGHASDDVISTEETRNADGSSTSTTTTRHKDGSTTTETLSGDGSSMSYSCSESNAKGHITGGRSVTIRESGDVTVTAYERNINTGEIRYGSTTVSRDGSTHSRTGRTNPGIMPSESGSRGVFDEALLYRLLPWMMDASYIQWKRESDLVKSGGRIAQPGRGEQPTLVLNEGPEVGVEGVVNCGAETNPCARPAGVAVDPRRGFGNISQPGRGVGPDAPAETGPRPPTPPQKPPPQ